MCSNKTHLKFLEYGAAFVGCGRWIINTSTECRIDCATALVRVLRYELAKMQARFGKRLCVHPIGNSAKSVLRVEGCYLRWSPGGRGLSP